MIVVIGLGVKCSLFDMGWGFELYLLDFWVGNILLRGLVYLLVVKIGEVGLVEVSGVGNKISEF